MRPLAESEKALLVDSKGRRYLITLQDGGSFHFHRGIVLHNDLIGSDEGRFVKSTGGDTLLVLRPTFEDLVMKMQRGAQVVYPKDSAMIVMAADIYPGASVIEAGAGSGALSMALLRAIGTTGKLVTYELREDFAEVARRNVENVGFDNYELRLESVYEPEFPEGEQYDRAVLDLPEPWRAAAKIASVLRPGGVLACYLPTVLQVHRLHGDLESDGRWAQARTFETLVRTWHVEERSMRPDHRMVAHTGFITTARRVIV